MSILQKLPGLFPVLIPEQGKALLCLPSRLQEGLGQMNLHSFQLLLADVPQVLSVGNLPLGMESGLEPIEGIFRRLVQGILHGQP